MNIEEALFNKYEVDKAKLIKYGFKKGNDKLVYKKNILEGKFTIIVEYDKKIKGKIIELEFNDEYTNFRREVLGTFNSNIRQEFIDLLTDIRDKCFIKSSFKFSQTKRINEFIHNKYGINPEFLWDKFPDYAVYRNSKKWFALIANIMKNKVDKKSNSIKEVEIINLKVQEDKINLLLSKKGYYEAFHMNKKNWISIILDDTLSDDIIIKLIEDSYNAISSNKTKFA